MTVRRLLEAHAAPNVDMLIAAANGGHTRIVELLITHGAKVNACNEFGNKALSAAAAKGYTSTVELLLRSGATVDSLDGNGNTALSSACTTGHNEVAELLLQARADANRRLTEGASCLLRAVGCGSVSTVEVLLRSRANVAHRDIHGRTALIEAARLGHVDVLPLLLAADANVDSRDRRGSSAIMLVCARSGRTYLAKSQHPSDSKWMLRADAAQDEAHVPFRRRERHEHLQNLYIGSIASNTDFLSEMIRRSTNIDARDYRGRTALMYAAASGWTAAVQALIRAGADPTLRDANNVTARALWPTRHNNIFDTDPELSDMVRGCAGVSIQGCSALALCAAVERSDVTFVEKLLRSGVDVNERDYSGGTALSCAVQMSDITLTRLLIAAKADLNICVDSGLSILEITTMTLAKGGDTALQMFEEFLGTGRIEQYFIDMSLAIAVGNTSIKVVSALLASGADPNVHTEDGSPVLAVAARKGRYDCLQLLLDHRADANVRDHGQSVLHEAVLCGRTEVVNIVLAAGADANVPLQEDDPEGHRWTPLHVLAMRGLSSAAPWHPGQRPVTAGRPGGLRDDSTYWRTGYLTEKCVEDMACALLSNGAAIDAIDGAGQTPLMVAAAAERGAGLLRTLLEHASLSSANTH